MDTISFGPFRLYPTQRLLKKREDPVKLGARAFDILLVLVERAGEVVAHKDLIARVLAERHCAGNQSARAHRIAA